MPPHHEDQHIRITHHFDERFVDLLKTFFHSFTHQLTQLKEIIVASNAELQQSLTDLGVQLDKAKAEIVKKVSDLEAALAAAGGTTPEVDAALAALRGKVQELDDLNPDSP